MRQARTFSARSLLNIRLLSRHLVAALTLATALAWGMPSAQSAPAPTNDSAQAFVQQNIDRGYGILRDTRISADQRHAQFRTFFLGLMDARRIGMFTLGQYGNSAPKADVEAFLSAFSDYTVAVYESRLDKYKDQVLKVTGSTARAADDVVVNCDVTDPNRPADPPYKIAFRLRKNADGKYIVTDLNIEGIWQTLSQRSDFTGFLQQHGGHVADLVNDLKRQTQLLSVRS